MKASLNDLFYECRCLIAEVILGWAFDIYPSDSPERIELARFLLVFMGRRIKDQRNGVKGL